jgi:predicted Fe-Mo cluster-binding NifX family protein
MKVAITTGGPTMQDRVDPRFGRAAMFLFYDTETGKLAAHDNTQNMNAAQGAGIQAAELVSRLGAEALITGHCGPKAFRTLQAAGIKVFIGAGLTAAEAVEALQKGLLKAAEGADVDSHWT